MPALLALALASAVAATPPVCEVPFTGPLGYTRLKAFIHTRKITSLEALLPCLPEDFRSHFTLVFASRSPERDAVDFQTPRAIVFTKDARFVLAFTGDGKRPAGDRLQVLEYHDGPAAFALHEVQFGAGGVHFDDRPKSCAQCHSADPHPIWDSYSFWPGVYGSVTDVVPEGTREGTEYRKFLAERRTLPRYAALAWPTWSSVPPYSAVDNTTMERTPNLQLNKFLARYNARRILRRLKALPLYAEKRSEALRGLIGCDPLSLSPALVKRMQAQLSRELSQRRAMQEKDRQPLEDAALLASHGRDAARAEWLAALFGTTTRDWAMQLDRDARDTFDGEAMADDLVLTEMFRDAANEQPELGKFLRVVIDGNAFQANAFYDPDSPGGEKYRYGTTYLPLLNRLGGAPYMKQLRGACELLPKDAPARAPVTAAVTVPGVAAPANPLATNCASCHLGDGKVRALPFANAAKLKETLHATPELLDEVVARLRATDASRMPPNRMLTEAEIDALERYVKDLAR